MKKIIRVDCLDSCVQLRVDSSEMIKSSNRLIATRRIPITNLASLGIPVWKVQMVTEKRDLRDYHIDRSEDIKLVFFFQVDLQKLKRAVPMLLMI